MSSALLCHRWLLVSASADRSHWCCRQSFHSNPGLRGCYPAKSLMGWQSFIALWSCRMPGLNRNRQQRVSCCACLWPLVVAVRSSSGRCSALRQPLCYCPWSTGRRSWTTWNVLGCRFWILKRAWLYCWFGYLLSTDSVSLNLVQQGP
jgi:hypothetical protein